MKAVRVHEHGGPEVLRYEDVPEPVPEPNQVIVKIDVAGINFIDIYFRTGLYPTDLPFTGGQEAAGVVSAAGSEVSGIQPGDRVAYCGLLGGYAEYAAVPAHRLVKIPDGVDAPTAAALMVQGMTVHYLTHSTFPLQAGHTALVHAAAGGVGLLLVQVAKLRGARVIGTCSTEEKAALVRGVGADEVILYTEQDFQAEVQRLTDGGGVDVVYDSVGKATWEGSMNSLRPRGMMVFFGNASGPVPAIEPLKLTQKGSLFMTRPSLVNHVATREDLDARSSDLFGWVADGKLKVRIGETFPLTDAGKAHERLAGRLTTGKLLLRP